MSEFPRRFGSYVLLKRLARGGMGELDLAVTGGRNMEKLCVIKRVLPHLLASDSVQRFREEAMVVVRLSHGNLVGVLDAGSDGGELYLAMDFVEGKDLLATWNQCAARRVAFPVEIAAYIVKELARGLAYAHGYRDLRLVHRDISPANVLLSYTGEVKITDFGLATSRLKEQRTSPGIIYGKLAYLAPEQARGQTLDRRTDLYAAGILLWEMLTGQQLFPVRSAAGQGSPHGPPNGSSPQQGTPTVDALDKLRNPVIVAPSSITGRVPPALDVIALRALAIEPADRYQSGEELRADLASFLAKNAPETDAATLAAFMTRLFREQIESERTERDALLTQASSLLPGPMVGSAAGEVRTRVKDAAPAPDEGSNAPTAFVPPPGSASVRPPAVGAALTSVPAAVVLTGVSGSFGGGSGDWRPLERRPATSSISGELGFPSSSAPSRISPEPGPSLPWEPPGDDAPASTSEDAPELIPRQPADRRHPGVDRRASLSTISEGTATTGTAGGAGEGGGPAGDDRRVGTTLAGRYFLRRLCGEGAMGRVYEGHHIEIGRRVAIKILHPTYRHTPEVVERFRREARAASKIGHPNIVDVTDSGMTPDGAFFFVMEYLDGVDLEQLIQRDGALPIERALLIAAQVCRALDAAHAAGIIHRDLKPANVMLIHQRDEEDFVKVLDFGISKQSDLDSGDGIRRLGLTNPDVAVGTPIYMAPEQAAGHPSDARTDVYAVGELLYEMLTGKAPFAGNDVIIVFHKKATETPAAVRLVRPEVPVTVDQMLARAMARRPDDRQESMTALKEEIMGCLASLGQAPAMPRAPGAGGGTPLPAAAISTEDWRPRRGASPRSIWLVGAGLVAGLGTASLFLLTRTEGEGPREPHAAHPAETSTSGRTAVARGRGADRGSAAAGRPASAALEGGAALAAAEPAVNPATARTSRAETGAHAAGPSPTAGPSETPPLAPAALATVGDRERRHPRRREPGPDGAATGRPAVPVRQARSMAASFSGGGTALQGGGHGASSRAGGSGPDSSPANAAASATGATGSARLSPLTAPAPELLQRGRAAFARGDFPEAVRFGHLTITNGDALAGRLLLGDAFFKMNRFADALREYDAAVQIAPSNAQARRGHDLATARLGPR